MSLSFEIAPPRQGVDWEQALVFAAVPAVVAFAAILGLVGDARLAGLTAGGGFILALGAAAVLARPQRGGVFLNADRLLVQSGWLRGEFALSELVVAEARRWPVNASVPTEAPGLHWQLITDPRQVVVLPLRVGGELRLSLVEPEEFLHALREVAATPVA